MPCSEERAQLLGQAATIRACSVCHREGTDLWPSPVPNTGWFCRDEAACKARWEAGR